MSDRQAKSVEEGGRRRARRSGREELLLERQDLDDLRAWAEELGLADLLVAAEGEAEERLAERIRAWAVEDGWIDAGSASNATAQSRLVRESLGLPSFATEAAGEGHGFIRRLGVLPLLDRPLELARRLRLWLAPRGLADFMTASDSELPRIVGRSLVEVPGTSTWGVPDTTQRAGVSGALLGVAFVGSSREAQSSWLRPKTSSREWDVTRRSPHSSS